MVPEAQTGRIHRHFRTLTNEGIEGILYLYGIEEIALPTSIPAYNHIMASREGLNLALVSETTESVYDELFDMHIYRTVSVTTTNWVIG